MERRDTKRKLNDLKYNNQFLNSSTQANHLFPVVYFPFTNINPNY